MAGRATSVTGKKHVLAERVGNLSKAGRVKLVFRRRPRETAWIALVTNNVRWCTKTVVEHYLVRWGIETFHKVLKSDCRAEDAKLRTAQRLTNLIAVFCIIAWRVFWLTMVHRTNPATSADKVFTETEIAILHQLTGNPEQPAPWNIAHYLLAVAKLGGYLHRKNDGPPGNTVLWRGLSRLTDIYLGFEIRQKLMGN